MLASIDSAVCVQKRHWVSVRRVAVAIFSANKTANSSSDCTWASLLRHSRSWADETTDAVAESLFAFIVAADKGLELEEEGFDEEDSLCFLDCKWFWYAFWDE